jgi:hypothetical protein
MKYLTSLSGLFLLLTSVAAHAFEYQIMGAYEVASPEKEVVQFRLSWDEKEQQIQGLYEDNHFAPSELVAGSITSEGRQFNVKFPLARKGVQFLTFITSSKKIKKKASDLPVSIIAQDPKGAPVLTTQINGRMLHLFRSAQKQEDRSSEAFKKNHCRDKMGILEDMCGIYGGMIAEENDSANKCHLLVKDAIRMELRNDRSILLHLSDDPDFVTNTPAHLIGRLASQPQSSFVDLKRQSCHSLAGTRFEGDHCKRLMLSGRFSIEEDGKEHFTGTYTIQDEETKEFCRYSLSLDKLKD